MDRVTELSLYEMAYVCGGAERVAMVVLVALVEDGQVKISSARHRVEAVRREPRDQVEMATFEAIPDVGMVLGPALRAIAGSAAVGDVRRGLRDRGLVPASRLSIMRGGRKRRALRRELSSEEKPGPLESVAIAGTAGIAMEKIRRVFESPDPPKPESMAYERHGGPRQRKPRQSQLLYLRVRQRPRILTTRRDIPTGLVSVRER